MRFQWIEDGPKDFVTETDAVGTTLRSHRPMVAVDGALPNFFRAMAALAKPLGGIFWVWGNRRQNPMEITPFVRISCCGVT